MAQYGFGSPVKGAFGAVVERVTQALKQEGFGVLTTIDVAATLKAKLGQDMPPYLILGACNPGFASQALRAEPDIGLLLPCNVVVRQTEGGEVIVGFMDPEAVLGMVNKPEVSTLGHQVRAALQRVDASLRS